jgi:hypothetical protein
MSRPVNTLGQGHVTIDLHVDSTAYEAQDVAACAFLASPRTPDCTAPDVNVGALRTLEDMIEEAENGVHLLRLHVERHHPEFGRDAEHCMTIDIGVALKALDRLRSLLYRHGIDMGCIDWVED